MAVKTISPADVARHLADAGLNLIDVRTPAEFRQVHATVARSIPLNDLDPAMIATTAGRPICVICKSGGRSAKAAERLESAGIIDVWSVDGGTDAWVAAGLPVERGTRKAISLERQVRIVAGSLVLLGLILSWAVHPAFAALSAFVGAGLVFAGISDICMMGSLLFKMPWNR
jgi:rhodanese-related sulfurtransferase